MNRFVPIGLLLSLGFLSACSSNVKRGTVAMKVSDRIAHVAMNRGEVAKGDHVQLFSNRCRRAVTGEAPSCEKVSKGHGLIVQVLNDHYSEVAFDEGVQFAEGDFIEKHPH